MRGAAARPPGPRGRRFTGNALLYDADRVGFLLRAHREYGDCFSFDAKTVVLGDPAVVHDVFGRTNRDFLAEGLLFADRLDPAKISVGAEDWMTVRRKGWKGFHRDVVAAHAVRLVRHFDRGLRETGGAEVDVNRHMQAFSGDAIADYCLGADATGIPAAVAANVQAVLPLLASSALLPSWLPLPRNRRFHAARARTRRLLGQAVATRRAAAPDAVAGPRDLLDQLLQATDPPLSDGQIREFVGVNLLASFGVPGAALAWLVRELGLREDIRGKVAAEAAAAWGGDADQTPVLAALPYTEALVKEILRVYPPTWLMGRIVARGTTIGPWRLAPGDSVMFSPYVIHRDARWWDRPDEVLPERWLTGEPPHARHAYLPFGAGPRVCLGTHLGTMQLVRAISWLVHRYAVTVTRPAGPIASPQALLKPEGLRARFVPLDG